MYTEAAAVEKIRPSPVFIGLVVLTVVAAWLTTTDLVSPGIAVFLFVILAWILSVTFHEFAHAVVAWRSGDRSVAQRGYLTLDPRKYTHPILSIALPIFFVLIGGLPLPGGAVLINRAALSDRESVLVALAGPFTNLALGAMALYAVGGGLVDSATQPTLVAALGLFGIFQIFVFVLNMLPIPGLDGYAAIEPALPESTRQLLRPVAQYAFIILFIGLFSSPWLGRLFFDGVFAIVDLFGVSRNSFQTWYELFRFWGDIGLL